MSFFQIRGFYSGGAAQQDGLYREKRPGRRTAPEKERESASSSRCTALAATVGTGNIAGVATALTAGGPGALFWMWVSAPDRHDNRLCRDHVGNQVPVQG